MNWDEISEGVVDIFMLKTKISQVFGCSDIVTFKDLHRNIQNCFYVKLTRLRTYRVSDDVGYILWNQLHIRVWNVLFSSQTNWGANPMKCNFQWRKSWTFPLVLLLFPVSHYFIVCVNFSNPLSVWNFLM